MLSAYPLRMLPSILVLSCGLCTDGMLFEIAPFLFYWFVFFLLWTLVLGNIPYVRRIDTEQQMAPPSLWLFIGYVVLFICLAVPTMGSLILPAVLVFIVWLSRMLRLAAMKEPSSGRRAHRYALLIALFFIPLSYYNVIPALIVLR